MRKLQLLFFATLIHSCVSAQVHDGETMFDFTLNDVQGNSHSLYETLDEGKTVVLYCFATWDSYAWEFYQQQTLETFDANYGANGTQQCSVWRIECEPTNGSAQLMGPDSITGNSATDTFGNWLELSDLPVIDTAWIATQLGINFLPRLVIICPDRVVRYSDATSLYEMEQAVFETSCQAISIGYDPAIFSPVVERVCGSNVVDLQVVLKNLGTDTLQNVTIQISGATADASFPWSGELASYQSDTLTFSGLTLINDNPIGIAIADANDNTLNDSLEARSEVGYSQNIIKLELALDAYPDEVSWEIRNDQDSVIYTGGGYTIPYQFISAVFTLPGAGCYSFYLNDSNGDGLHGSQFGGFDGFCRLLSMNDSLNTDATLFDYDGSYNFTEVPNTASFVQIAFEAGSSLDVASTMDNQTLVYPNPANQWLRMQWEQTLNYNQLIIHDAFGRIIQDMPIMQGIQAIDLNTQDWINGMYEVTMISNLHRSSQRLMIHHN